MIPHIKTILITLLLLSCKQTIEQNKNTIDSDILKTTKSSSQNILITEQEEIPLDINGIWVCHKYISDGRGSEYGADYAKEVAKYSRLIIENSQLKMDYCTKNLYTYKYPTKLKKFDDESIFINHYKPKRDSVQFIGAINSGSDANCDIFDNYTFYVLDQDNIIHYDRGYFFYYEKVKDIRFSDNNYIIQGKPANNRSEWSVTGTFMYSKSLEDGYQIFRKEFPYGSKNTVEIFPISEEFLDSKNGIIYYRYKDEYKIIKDDPMGKIIIKILQNRNTLITFSYEMHYPEY